MFTCKRLTCSFCGKSAAQVSKLVAGPKVFICDACVAEASRIMSDPGIGGSVQAQPTPSLWRRISAWAGRRSSARSAVQAQHLTKAVESAF